MICREHNLPSELGGKSTESWEICNLLLNIYVWSAQRTPCAYLANPQFYEIDEICGKWRHEDAPLRHNSFHTLLKSFPDAFRTW